MRLREDSSRLGHSYCMDELMLIGTRIYLEAKALCAILERTTHSLIPPNIS